MTLFTLKKHPILVNAGAKLAAGALFTLFLSASPLAWSGEHDRHNGGHKNGYQERQRDSRPRSDHSRHGNDNHRDERHKRYGDHSKREYYARTEPRHHDSHRRHAAHHREVHRHPNHHGRHYYGSPAKKHHGHHKHYGRHYRHHGHNDVAFLLGGVILGAVLSDATRANDYYYDGFEHRRYRSLESSSCYQSYYDNGRRVLVEVPRDYCRAY